MLTFRFKIVISLISLSLVSFALGAYNTRHILLDLFENVVIDRSSDGFRYDVISYFNLYGSWENAFDAETFEQYRMRAGRPAPHFNPEEITARFVATDLDGKVWVPGESNEFGLGVIVSQSALDDAIPLLRSRDDVIGYVLAEGEMLPTEIEERYLQGLRHSWWISLLLVAGISIPLGQFLGSRLTKPINHLISAIGNMSPTSLNQKVPVNSKDELGMLSLSFNQMSTDLADFVQVVKNQKEKISQTEQLLRQGLINISHELRTPLYTSISQAQAMLDGIRELNKAELKNLYNSLDHLSHLVDDLYFLSLSDVKSLRFEFEMVDLCSIIQDCINARLETFTQRNLSLTANLPAKCEIDGDKTRLRQIVDNLLGNCQKYSESGAEIEVELRVLPKSVELVVSDSGPGVPPENLELIFDRFYKGYPAETAVNDGLGLGLSIVKTCAEIHGGDAKAFLSEQGGLCVIVSLPISDSQLPKNA